VRGLANADLTANLALQLAASAGRVLAEARGVQGRAVAVVARDTRASGEFLEAAVVAGLASAGIDVLLVGVVPTPAAAFLTDHLDADLGVMLSASHNPMPDNGIKFFARGGVKLDDAIEDRIEADLQGQLSHARPTGADVGRVRLAHDAWQAYSEHLLGTIRHRLTGLRVVLDCANGAASAIGPGILTAAGAEVIALHAEPDGLNINVDCGSTHLDSLITAVREHGYDLGIALDGDADRCLAVDHTGAVVDGDHVLALLGLALREQGVLTHETIVGTVMANLGFINAMRELGIGVVQTQVGDRYVLESMREFGYRLGGEPSGHVILADHASTGDGLLTALHIMDRMAQTGKSLQELASIVTKYPQVLINVGGVDRAGLAQNANVAQAVAQAEQALGESGRVLLRPSGTEPLVRVMVEAASQEQAVRVAEELAAVVAAELTDQSA
jgi:phosphoglucosamine mutase